jgi:hypothetical protein
MFEQVGHFRAAFSSRKEAGTQRMFGPFGSGSIVAVA